MFVSLLCFIDLMVHSYNFYLLGQFENLDDQVANFKNLFVLSLLNQLSVYVRYFLISMRLGCYSQFDRDFDQCRSKQKTGDDHDHNPLEEMFESTHMNK